MQTAAFGEFITGVFVCELKNRFLCLVNISGEDVVCYVPSSCHLSNFLDLKGKTVILIPTKTIDARTKYSIFAIPYKRNYIILNTYMSNKALENSINSRRFSFLGKRKSILSEYCVKGYKTDFFIEDSNTLIEVKSVISLNSNAVFPIVYSERTQQQLKHIQRLILDGYKACFIIISLNPYVKSVCIDKNTAFYQEYQKCISMGMISKAYSCRLTLKDIVVERELNILIDDVTNSLI